jgi:CRISPR-associated protein Cas6
MLNDRSIVEVAWPIAGGSCPAHRGYHLFSALCRAGLVFHDQPDTIVLPPNGYLVIRAPEPRAWRMAGSGVANLDIGGWRLELGPPEVRPLVPAGDLSAWCVTIKGATCDGSLRRAVLAQLGHMGVAVGPARVEVGHRRVLWVAGAGIVGYGVRLRGLDEAGSRRVQARGIGGRTRMGCGGFVPCR